MVPYLFNPPRSPLKVDIILNKYPLYKVYMGLIIRGTIPRVPAFSLWDSHPHPSNMSVQNFKSKWSNLSGPTAILRPNVMLMDVPPFLHSASTCCLLACFFYSIQHSAYMAMYQWYELYFEIMKRPRYTSWLSFRLCWFSFDWSPWTAIRQWTNDKIYPENNYTWSRSIDTDIITGHWRWF